MAPPSTSCHLLAPFWQGCSSSLTPPQGVTHSLCWCQLGMGSAAVGQFSIRSSWACLVGWGLCLPQPLQSSLCNGAPQPVLEKPLQLPRGAQAGGQRPPEHGGDFLLSASLPGEHHANSGGDSSSFHPTPSSFLMLSALTMGGMHAHFQPWQHQWRGSDPSLGLPGGCYTGSGGFGVVGRGFLQGGWLGVSWQTSPPLQPDPVLYCCWLGEYMGGHAADKLQGW